METIAVHGARFVLLAVLLGTACHRAPSHRAGPTLRNSAGVLGPALSGEAVSKEDRERAALKVLEGGPLVMDLPVLDRDPDKQWNPSLRDTVQPRASAAPRILIGLPTVIGALAPAVVHQILGGKYARFRLCYEMALSRGEDFDGVVDLAFTVNQEGKAVDAQFGHAPTSRSPHMTECVRRLLLRLDFPPPEHGTATVNCSIKFEQLPLPPAEPRIADGGGAAGVH